VFRPLVRVGASAAIVAHNHPSGETFPSREDIRLTAMLRQTGDLLGIPLLDHIIVSGGGFHSIADVLKPRD
jgi:DNA repair protein RadC